MRKVLLVEAAVQGTAAGQDKLVKLLLALGGIFDGIVGSRHMKHLDAWVVNLFRARDASLGRGDFEDSVNATVERAADIEAKARASSQAKWVD